MSPEDDHQIQARVPLIDDVPNIMNRTWIPITTVQRSPPPPPPQSSQSSQSQSNDNANKINGKINGTTPTNIESQQIPFKGKNGLNDYDSKIINGNGRVPVMLNNDVNDDKTYNKMKNNSTNIKHNINNNNNNTNNNNNNNEWSTHNGTHDDKKNHWINNNNNNNNNHLSSNNHHEKNLNGNGGPGNNHENDQLKNNENITNNNNNNIDYEQMNGGKKNNGTTIKNGASNNNNNNNRLNHNGNGNGIPLSEKLAPEQEPLTGIFRQPDLDEISSCGIGSCQPKWARMCASTHMFMVVFLLAWILQGMYHTYFVSVITTIEKLFQIKSKTTGLMMSATEVGQISTALFLTYFAGRGHRPRWIACGMVLFAIASFGITLPHFIFGNELLHANNALYSSGTTQSKHTQHQHEEQQRQHQVMLNNAATDSTQHLNDSVMMMSNSRPSDDYGNLCKYVDQNNFSQSHQGCEEEILVEQAAHSQITTAVLGIFFVSLLGVGIGQTAVSTLGIPYIDDNVASRESPIYITITIGVRILGPAAGFVLGSFCTRLYIDLSDPGIEPGDPRWLGAWYLGLVLISSLMFLTSLAMFTFPKHLRGNRIPPPMKMRAIEAQKKLEKQEEDIKPKLKDFPKTIKRQLSNDILMFRTASSVLHLLPVAGLYTFMPKYLETQFRLPAHDANLITGIGGILVMGVGIVISGIVILKFSPTARSVAAWIAFAAIVYSAGMAVLMFIGCPMDNYAQLKTYNNEQPIKFEPTCNVSCSCDTSKFSPICGENGLTYFSSCQAGCQASNQTASGKTEYFDCLCIPPMDDYGLSTATSGYCDGNCQSFLIFLSLFSFLVFVHSTSEVGSMLLIMRCTDPKDKAMAMGIIQFAIGLFGNVPCPIIYGAVIDSTCLIWETICEKQGACSLYNTDDFRHFFLGTTSGIMFLAFIMDVIVWKKAHRIDIDPESNSSENDCERPALVPATDATV